MQKEVARMIKVVVGMTVGTIPQTQRYEAR